jgi:hypothetical protein
MSLFPNCEVGRVLTIRSPLRLSSTGMIAGDDIGAVCKVSLNRPFRKRTCVSSMR